MALSKEYSFDQVAFTGVTIDSPWNVAKIKPFSQSVGISYPLLLVTDQDLMRELNLSLIPTLIIINSDNEVYYTFNDGVMFYFATLTIDDNQLEVVRLVKN